MMTMITTTKYKLKLGALALLLGFGSCQEYLDVAPDDKLNEDQVYRDVFDADAAVVGIYGKLMGLAGKYVILNELRADLISPTYNAGLNLKELNEHSVTTNNPYASPKDFYEVINDCNDVLKNFDLMRLDNRLDSNEYNERYSDIGTLRSWLYLQLGIHFGQVPYITDPVENLDDVRNLDQYARIPFEQLLEELIIFTLKKDTELRKKPHIVEMHEYKLKSGRVKVVFGQAANKPFDTIHNLQKIEIGKLCRK